MIRKSRAKNKTIGSCLCSSSWCNEVAEVRKIDAKRADLSRMYLVCPSCGIDDRQGAALKKYIENGATFFDGSGVGAAPVVAAPVSAPVVKVAPKAVPQKTSEPTLRKVEPALKKPGFFESLKGLMD